MERLAGKDATLKKVMSEVRGLWLVQKEVKREASFSKDSVAKVCNDLQAFQVREVELKGEIKQREGVIEEWKAKVADLEVEALQRRAEVIFLMSDGEVEGHQLAHCGGSEGL